MKDYKQILNESGSLLLEDFGNLAQIPKVWQQFVISQIKKSPNSTIGPAGPNSQVDKVFSKVVNADQIRKAIFAAAKLAREPKLSTSRGSWRSSYEEDPKTKAAFIYVLINKLPALIFYSEIESWNGGAGKSFSGLGPDAKTIQSIESKIAHGTGKYSAREKRYIPARSYDEKITKFSITDIADKIFNILKDMTGEQNSSDISQSLQCDIFVVYQDPEVVAKRKERKDNKDIKDKDFSTNFDGVTKLTQRSLEKNMKQVYQPVLDKLKQLAATTSVDKIFELQKSLKELITQIDDLYNKEKQGGSTWVKGPDTSGMSYDDRRNPMNVRKGLVKANPGIFSKNESVELNEKVSNGTVKNFENRYFATKAKLAKEKDPKKKSELQAKLTKINKRWKELDKLQRAQKPKKK